MTTMTCRKTLQPCQTPGMCAPHGGRMMACQQPQAHPARCGCEQESPINELALLRLGYGNACRERDALQQRCGELEARPEQAIAAALAARLLESPAANYVESTFTVEGIDGVAEITVILRRIEGKTPHELRRDAEQERDALRAEVERLRKAMQDVCAVIDADTRDIVRDLLNRFSGLENGAHPNDVSESLDSIERIIEQAMEATQCTSTDTTGSTPEA